jgi:hypothetical protein
MVRSLGRWSFPAGSLARIVLIWFLGFTLASPMILQAQVSTGTINGTVRDQSGAVVPNAMVTLENVATGVKRTTQSNNAGIYAFFDIHPGTYTLQVVKEGFRSATETHIVVQVNQTMTYNFTLQVGSPQQAVTVQAAAAAIETSTSELGTAVTTRSVNDLPLNGRNFTELLSLTPGVSPLNVSQSNGFMANPVGSFTFPSVNGQTNRSNFYFLDGVNNQNDYASAYAVAPVVDDIQEFKVQSHNDEARFGGVLGGIINVVTKSGTNQLHGSAWEFVRNNAFDARDPFFSSVTPFKQNQFGGTVGGPVVLPHYNGRNRTFFFGSYEGFRSVRTSQSLYRVPTPAELSGDLSDLSVPIYNPFSTRPDPANPGKLIRDAFVNNQIPASLINQGMITYAKALFPAPIQTGISGINGINNFSNTTRQDEYSGRVDETINPMNSLWFRYSGFTQPVLQAGGYAGNVLNQHTVGKNWGASWLHTFGPSATLQLEFGHNNVALVQNTGWPGASLSLIQQAGFSSGFACTFQHGPSQCEIPGINITGFLSGGPLYFESPASDVWETKGDFTKIHGRNTLGMGFDINKSGFNGPYGKGAVDNYENETFTSFETSNLETSTGGSALASFLLGVPDSASLRGTYTTEYGAWIDGFYFQDQIKATNRLTINLGGRYDVTLRPLQGSLKDGNLYIGDLDLNNGTYILQAQPPSCAQAGRAPCIPGGALPDHVVVTSSANHSIIHNTYDNVQPRVGLAYSLNSKTVIRASAGRFFDNWAAVTQSGQNYTGTWPEIIQFLGQNLNPTIPTVFAQNPFGNQVATALPGPTPFNQTQWYLNPLIQNPYSWQWNFGIQRQVTTNTLLTANYVGSANSRLDLGPYENVAPTPGPGNPQARDPYPYIHPTFYDNSIGRSHYNAFQFQLKRTFSQGLTYLVSYTWSKSMDIGCSGWFGVEGCSIQNPYDLNANKSVSGFDLTHDLSVSWVYQLPFGSGAKFQTGNPVLDHIVGHWQLNGIATFTSGAPYDVGVSGDIANTGNSSATAYYERLNLVGNPKLSNPTTAEWFNRAAFAVPVPFTFGTLGRNALRADWFKNLDLSLFRQFPITETKRLEFRFETFNTTNVPTWGIPDRNFSDPTFGQVLSTRSVERELQFALKFYF